MSQSNSSQRIQSDGLELVVEEFGNRSGTPFIFAHGLTSNRAQSRLQMAPLAERYRVIVFDQGRKLTEGSPEAVHADPRVLEAYLGVRPRDPVVDGGIRRSSCGA